MVLADVVTCAGGLLVAQRGARLPAEGHILRVGEVKAVSPPDAAPTEARSSDNVVWRRHWLEGHRLVIEFVNLAMVEVASANGTVVFDRDLPSDMEQHLLFDHVLPLALARDGALVLHAGVISRGGKGVVLVGPSGAGKSTVTAFAWQKDWTVGGDDGAVLVATRPPTVEPTYGTVRLTPQSAHLLGFPPGGGSSVVGKMRLGENGMTPFRQPPVELRLIAVVEPAPAGATARFHELTAIEAHARLFGSTFHADFSGDRLLSAVVDGLASIVETTPVRTLSVPRGLDGLVGAERLLRAAIDEEDDRWRRGAAQTAGREQG